MKPADTLTFLIMDKDRSEHSLKDLDSELDRLVRARAALAYRIQVLKNSIQNVKDDIEAGV